MSIICQKLNFMYRFMLKSNQYIGLITYSSLRFPLLM